MGHRKLIADLLKRRGGLYSFIGRRVRSQDDVPDLVQETYLRMLRTAGQPIEDPESYLLAVAGNLIKEHSVMKHRRAQREVLASPLELPELPVHVDYAGEQDQVTLNARLARIVKQLPARYQLVLSLTYDEGLPQSRIAERLNVSRSMVQKILIKAHAHCRERLALGGSK